MAEHLKCINDENMFIESEESTKNFSSVKIRLEHCIDNNPAEQCPPDDMVSNYWSKAVMAILVKF